MYFCSIPSLFHSRRTEQRWMNDSIPWFTESLSSSWPCPCLRCRRCPRRSCCKIQKEECWLGLAWKMLEIPFGPCYMSKLPILLICAGNLKPKHKPILQAEVKQICFLLNCLPVPRLALRRRPLELMPLLELAHLSSLMELCSDLNEILAKSSQIRWNRTQIKIQIRATWLINPSLDVLLPELLDLVPVLLARTPREHESTHDGGAENTICNEILI